MPTFINTTSVFVFIIIGFFIFFIFQASKIYFLYKNLAKIKKEEDLLSELSTCKISSIKEDYEKSINIKTPDGTKTNIPSTEYFSEFNVCKTQKLNLRLLDTASGTLVGLGLLGTFFGLTVGIENFDSSNSTSIMKSIQTLLSGMGTAFMTSLVGMLLSIAYTLCDKQWRNKLTKLLYDLTEQLDNTYYIDDASLNLLNQKNLFINFYSQIKNVISQQSQDLLKGIAKTNEKGDDLIQQNSEILEKLTCNDINGNPISIAQQNTEILGKLIYTTPNGENVTIGNAVREILKENTEQSKALKSFSTDLAIELNNGFDEVLSRQMQERILPLMENVDKTTQAIVEHIDNMADSVSSPATDMIQKMVDELKSSMTTIIADFNKNLSGSATSELENLAKQLGSAGQSITAFPEMIESVSSTLQSTIEEVKNAVSEISDTSANANSTAMQQMQEQISLATGAIGNALSDVKEVMSSMSKSSQVQSDEMIDRLSQASGQMGDFLNGTIKELTTSLQDSMREISEHMNLSIADMTKASTDANSSNIQQMQDQMNFATDTIKLAIDDVKSTMDNMAQTSLNNNTAMTGNLVDVSEKISTLLDGTISHISTSINDSMKDISVNMNEAISNITKTSTEANSSNIQQMQDQMNFATDAIRIAINDVKTTMENMTHTSQNSNNEMTGNLITVSEKISSLLEKTMTEISSSVHHSMKNITDEVNQKQTELVNLQKETTQQTKYLLDSFNVSLNRLEQMNEYVKGTMNMFQKAQGEITGSTAHLQTITGHMQTATQTFNNSQKDYSEKMASLQRDSQQNINAISELLENAGNLSSEYADQFTTIKMGLVSIFSQLQTGLNEYSRTVQATTQKYLDQYSSSLTETANVLSSSINQQGEVVEMLTDALNNHRK